MDRLSRFARRIFALGAGSSMALVFLVIFVNSVRRYTIGKSIAWGEELPIYLTIYGVMFGIAYAYMTDSHIRFAVFLDMLEEKIKRFVLIACDLLTAATGVTLIFAGHAFAMRRGSVASSGLKSTGDWLAQITGIPWLEWVGKVGTWQYAIVLGGAMLAIAAILRLSERLSAPSKAKEPVAPLAAPAGKAST
ncbi:TRAP transporter small permease [Cohaesibacter haloalkalitolerans]|uniref:TRAP transporter small permease n=1 Tax=Cohaesibacter haloalkalitolerans TaxID=1162980 RepID=UPI000E65989B|nr:TRAP transporter small permease subunit [Cohaesibacter haloalkalitolerans]